VEKVSNLVKKIIQAENHVKILEDSLLTPYDFENEVISFQTMTEAYRINENGSLIPKILTSAHKIRGYLKRNPETHYQPSLVEKGWL